MFDRHVKEIVAKNKAKTTEKSRDLFSKANVSSEFPEVEFSYEI